MTKVERALPIPAEGGVIPEEYAVLYTRDRTETS